MAAKPQTLSPPEPERLVEAHLEYARVLAAKVRREIGTTEVELDELVAYARRGLVEAAQRFDPGFGVAFTTFSYYRIRGAIFDGLRELGWLGRSEYARFQAGATELLGNAADRPRPANEALEQGLARVANTIDQLATVFVTSLDAQAGHPEVADDRIEDADTRVERQQRGQAVRCALRTLPDRERRLLEQFYYEGKSLKEAGESLGMSKSWASRLHARALTMLTAALGPSFEP